MKKTRKRYSTQFKAKVALEAIRGDLMLAELAAKHGIHHTMIASWKRPTPTKAASLPASPLPACSGRRRSASAWMVGALDGQCVHRTAAALTQI